MQTNQACVAKVAPHPRDTRQRPVKQPPPRTLEQQLRSEGHQVSCQRGPIGTTEWLLKLRG